MRFHLSSRIRLSAVACAWGCWAQSAPPALPNQPALEIGREIAGRLEKHQVHTYPFRLEAGQFARLSVTRVSDGLNYRVSSPAGRTVVDNQQHLLLGSYESFVTSDAAAPAGGEYLLSIVATELPGPYRVKLQEVRATVPEDQLRLKAQQIREAFDIPDHRAADAPLREALGLLRQAGEERGMLLTMIEILQNSRQMNRQRHDRALCEEAIELSAKLGDRWAETKARSIYGVILSDLNEKARAIEELEKSIALSTELNDAKGLGRALSLAGDIYSVSGQEERALTYYARGAPILRESGNEGLLASVLFGNGRALGRLGRWPEARPLLEESIALSRKLNGADFREAIFLLELASAAEAGNQMDRALEFITEALAAARKSKDEVGIGDALIRLARHYGSRNDWAKAIPVLKESVDHFRTTGVGLYLPTALSGLARAHFELADAGAALPFVREAIGVAEAALARAGGSEAQANYFATFRNLFSLEAAILHLAGKDGEAFEVSERSRARGLASVLASAGIDLRAGVSPDLQSQSSALEKAIATKLSALAAVERKARQQAEADAIRREIDDLRHQQDRVLARIRDAHPNYASLTQFAGIAIARVREELLDADTVLLEYLLDRDRNYVWAVTRDGTACARILRRAEVDKAAHAAYAALTARNLNPEGEAPERRRARIEQADRAWQDAAAELSELLLKPVAASLAGKKRWLVVSDESLHRIPFGALPAPSAGAPDSREVVNLPSAAVLAMIRRLTAGRKPAAKTVAVFADPVFENDDPRLTEVSQRTESRLQAKAGGGDEIQRKLKLPRLPFTRREADVIAALAAPGGVSLAVGLAATRAAAQAPEVASHRILHFATHGLLNEDAPALSGVALSMFDETGRAQNGFLRLHDIYNLKLPVDLVVLSACQSALGKRLSGEGLIGLARGMMFAGAARVVASLWKVDDAATAELMRLFYEAMLVKGEPPAAALFTAQRKMAAQRRWSSPYYWAAFQLHGEYR